MKSQITLFEEWAEKEGINVYVYTFTDSKDIMTSKASACWSAWMACYEHMQKDVDALKQGIDNCASHVRNASK